MIFLLSCCVYYYYANHHDFCAVEKFENQDTNLCCNFAVLLILFYMLTRISQRQSVPSLIGHFNNRRVANEVIQS